MSTWITLPHLTGLKLQGDDAVAFAHAQFTSEISADRNPGWQLSGWCNPKGKVISVMLARTQASGVDLVAPAAQLQYLASRLPLFAIGRKVQLVTELPVAGSLEPAQDPACALGLDPGRGLALEADAEPGDPEAVARWQALDICAGIAWLTPARSEQFLPQALGLEERGGLSYRKGCYPGQEVIARVHYLGKAKERLLGFRLDGQVEGSDQELCDEHGQRLGRTLQSVFKGSSTVGLAVVGVQHQPGQSIRCADHAGRLSEPADLC